MVDAIVSFALHKLTDLLTGEVVFRQGVRENVEWLKNELGYMQSFIKDADEKQGGDHRVRQWVSEVLDVAYETVDILESFSIEAEEREAKKRGIVDYVRSYTCICVKETNLYGIGMKIEALKKRVLDISRRRESYGITNIGTGGLEKSTGPAPNHILATMKPLRRATSWADEEYVVGFHDVVETLLAELLKDDPRRCVISIYGMGGLGKTTIARKLYNSAEVGIDFSRRAWICVSQEFRTRDLLQCIIRSFKGGLTKEELELQEKMAEEDLERLIRQLLDGHRYLVVVDDLWHREAWESLRRAFPATTDGSRVIITTRKKDVAMRADDRSIVHELRFLNADESWSLFCRKAFRDGDVNCCPSPMENLAREMLAKCNGLPLAIIVLGGLLKHKRWPKEWLKVKEDIWRHLKNDSFEISQLLNLSYNDLPPEMKQCFLYLGMFPEDCVIDTERLMQLWMAEEFITTQKMEDLAEDYLNELISRSLIQVAERFWEEVVKCRVHDLLRDLAIEKAIDINFFAIFDPPRYSSILLRRRHAIHSQLQTYFSIGFSNSKLRSLVFFNQDQESLGKGQVKFLCLKFKLLRVLDLQGVKFGLSGRLPDSIGELIHLKFLRLIDTDIRELPASIANLKRLQTLEATSECNFKLPREILELKQLRHMHGYFEGSLHIDSLTEQVSLKYVGFHQWIEIDTSQLINLQELVINGIPYSGLASIRALHSIAKLESLDTLILDNRWEALLPLQPLSSCQHLLKLWLYGRMEKPGSLNKLPTKSLTRLILSSSGFSVDPMPTLGTFPNLRYLDLIKSYNGNQIVCSANGFPQLKVLRLSGFRELEDWQVEEGAMPRIRGLLINDCSKLRMIPERLKYVPTVRKSESNYLRPTYTG